MRDNDFVLRISQELDSDGYVELKHETYYKVILANYSSVDTDVTLCVDGTEVGVFRIQSRNIFSTDRGSNARGKFVYLALGTEESKQAGLSGNNPSLGLVSATFKTGTVIKNPVSVVRSPFSNPDEYESYGLKTMYSSRSGERGGGTGLGEASSINFNSTEKLDYDGNEHTLHLRLITKKPKYSPLVSTNKTSTPIPPAL